MASRLVLRQSPLSCNFVLCHARKVALARSCSSPSFPPCCNPPADPAAHYSPPAVPGNDLPTDSTTNNPPATSGGNPSAEEPPAAPCPGDRPHTGEAPPVGTNPRGTGFYVPTHQGHDP